MDTASTTMVIGSRGSQLALWQARHVASRLEQQGIHTRIEIIKTTGDRLQTASLIQAGGKGLFTKEIEEALLAGVIDLAVHSLKDLPTDMPDGLTIAAIPERENPFDAIVGSTLHALRAGAGVGTSSSRRSAQLLILRPDLEIKPIRGNVDTRLRKQASGEFDAILLAAAGLRRLGLEGEIAEIFSASQVCPAPGQGALAIQTRADDPAIDLCRPLHHAATGAAVECERALLAMLGGGCRLPVGAFASEAFGELYLTAVVVAPDGSQAIRETGKALLATRSALASKWRNDYWNAVRRVCSRIWQAKVHEMKNRALRGLRIVVTRAMHQAAELADLLAAQGAEPILLPVIAIAPPEDKTRLIYDAEHANEYDWIIFTSVNAITFFMAEVGALDWFGPAVATVGAATRDVAENYGLRVRLMPEKYVAEALVEAFARIDLKGKKVLIPSAAVTRDFVAGSLRNMGAEVNVVEAYRNVVPAEAHAQAELVFREPLPDWVTFASSSAVDHLVQVVDRETLGQVRIAAIGPVTSDTIRTHGLEVAAEAKIYSLAGLVDAIKAAL